jgi:flavodoxin
MSIWVAYYSHHGNNATLARHLAQRLGCGLVPIRELKPRTNLTILWDVLFGRCPRIQPVEQAFGESDRVILVAPVWAGKLAAPIRTFLRLYREQLHDYSFITLCGYERPEQRAWLSAELARRVGRPPRAVCELRVSDLVSPEQRQSLRVINGYQVQEAELRHYQPAIEEFLRSTDMQRAAADRSRPLPSPARGLQPTNG